MKIGILTFHRAHNYGTVLQAYALQKTLIKQGYNVEIIDYKSYVNKRTELLYFFKRKNIIKTFWDFIFKFNRIYKQQKVFNKFINQNLHISIQIKSIDDFKNLNYDTFIIGSDQVWNTQITKGYDPVYWGNFETQKRSIKITYAVSMKINDINSGEQFKIKSFLNNFTSISVREDFLKNKLQTLTDKEITTAIDPTLLAGKELFSNITTLPKIKKKYILIYQVVHSGATQLIAKQIAKKINAEIIEIETGVPLLRSRNKLSGISPNEFLGWIKNAEWVITTSFHGTAFSILFEKSFFAIKLNNEDYRIISILRQLQLEEYFISGILPEDKLDKVINKKINWENVMSNLKEEREKSLNILIHSLKSDLDVE